MIIDEVLRSTIEQSWWNETQSYWVYTWLDTSGPESELDRRAYQQATRAARDSGDAENAGLEYAGPENAAPTQNEKIREHR